MARSSVSGDKSSKFWDEAAGCGKRGGVAGGDPPVSDATDEPPDPPEDSPECSPSSEPGGDGLPPSSLLDGEPSAGDPG
uniref:Uncharacterized protein n=1 Tax=Phytophthora fragariae TaxID=53985 RepID=A0A6A3EDB9_9STRA|nr:hypothetical protein PF009_g21695 [Phytophthora fragariae]